MEFRITPDRSNTKHAVLFAMPVTLLANGRMAGRRSGIRGDEPVGIPAWNGDQTKARHFGIKTDEAKPAMDGLRVMTIASRSHGPAPDGGWRTYRA